MTWRELTEKIEALTPEQQEMEVIIEGFLNLPSWNSVADLQVIEEKPALCW